MITNSFRIKEMAEECSITVSAIKKELHLNNYQDIFDIEDLKRELLFCKTEHDARGIKLILKRWKEILEKEVQKIMGEPGLPRRERISQLLVLYQARTPVAEDDPKGKVRKFILEEIATFYGYKK